MKHKKVLLGGMPIDVYSRTTFAEQMVEDWKANQAAGGTLRPKIVWDQNGQGLSMAATDKRFHEIMTLGDYIVADSMPMVLASRWFTKTPLPERIAMTDFVHNSAFHAGEAGMSFYLLGDRQEVADAAAATLKRLYPKLRIAGVTNGFFKEGSPEEDAIIKNIVESKADVLWIAMGRPKQEEWVLRNIDRLRGVTWLKPTGGLYNFLAGTVNRAPQWMQDWGLEWFFRLCQEPRRLFYRYATTNIHAAWLLLTKSGDID